MFLCSTSCLRKSCYFIIGFCIKCNKRYICFLSNLKKRCKFDYVAERLVRHVYKSDCKNHFFIHGFDRITDERKHCGIFVYVVMHIVWKGLTRVLMGIACNYFSVLYISIICVIRNPIHLVRFSCTRSNLSNSVVSFPSLPLACIILSLNVCIRSCF